MLQELGVHSRLNFIYCCRGFYHDLLHLFFFITSLLIIFLISCIVASRDADIKDDSRIVSDEMGGMLLTLFMVSMISDGIFFYLIGFALFRAFDIAKPWPISYVDQNLKNGFGVFLDDLIAGFLSFLVFFVFIYYLLNLSLIFFTILSFLIDSLFSVQISLRLMGNDQKFQN